MNLEKEVWSRINRENFDSLMQKLEAEVGTPKITKRISFQVTDFDRKDLDTRVRITNGQAEIMQKVGDWTQDTREEISTPLNNDPETILSAYKRLRNMLTAKHVETTIVQTENYIFANKQYEIKLTHQTGKTDVYNYEIEVFDLTLDPVNIVNFYGIPLDSPENTPEFWKEWNEKVNLDSSTLSDLEIIKLIKNHL